MQRFTQGSDAFVSDFFETTLQPGRHRDTGVQPNESDLPSWDIQDVHSSTSTLDAIAHQCTSDRYYYDYSTCNPDQFTVQTQPQWNPYFLFQYSMSPWTYSPTLTCPVVDLDIGGYGTSSIANGEILTVDAVDRSLSTPHRRPTDPLLGHPRFANTDQDDLLTPGLPSAVPYTSAKASRRPAPSGKPDCAPSLQRAFGGVLWSLDFHCEWNECPYVVHRADFQQYEDYLESVIKHLKRHSGPRRPGWTCKWQGVCQAKITRSVRDQQRHLRSHLPFYNLCIQCGKFAARPDARGRSNPCRRGTCRPQERIRDKISEATNSGHNETLEDFYNAVFY